jgi:ADP-ribose pyrophosphatase YjhB (NUDIX family)
MQTAQCTLTHVDNKMPAFAGYPQASVCYPARQFSKLFAPAQYTPPFSFVCMKLKFYGTKTEVAVRLFIAPVWYDGRMIQCTFEDGGQASLRHVTVDTLVLKDGKILLVKRTGRLLEGGKWALVGGFVDRDETTAQAAAREIHEETCWTVKDITLLKINDNPDRPKEDRQNISFVYVCQALEKTGEPDDESDDQQWFALDELPPAEQIAFDHFDNITFYKTQAGQAA